MENLVRSIRRLQQRLLVPTRLRDLEDAASVIRREGDTLDDRYVLHRLRQFEQALNDSTLVAEYTRLRAASGQVIGEAGA